MKVNAWSDWEQVIEERDRLEARISELEAFVGKVATDPHGCVSPGYMGEARKLLERPTADGGVEHGT